MTETTEQLVLIPDKPLELESGWATLQDLAHEEVPEATKQLLDSIRRFGLLQPLLIREAHVGGFDADGIEHGEYRRDIVDGRRRLWCCRELGIDPIPVMVAETDLAIADVATLATNATRTSNPIAEFTAIKRLVAKNATIKDISGATGMAQGTIKARLGLLRLDESLMEAFEHGKITQSTAERVAKLPPVLQKKLVETFIAEGKITATDVHEVRLAQQQAATTGMFDLDVEDDGSNDPNEHPGQEIRDEGPIELVLADELQSIIARMPEEHPTLTRSLEWVASILTDLAMGQQPQFVAGFDLAVKDGAITMMNIPKEWLTDPAEPLPYLGDPEEEPPDLDTSDQEPYPAELADDERYPGMERDVVDDLFDV